MVSIDRPCPAHAKASARAQALSTMYQAARPHGENGYAAYGASGVFYLLHEIEDTSTKSKVWKYFDFPVDENRAVTNKKQVVGFAIVPSHTRETQQTCFITSKPTIQSNAVK